MANTKSLSSPEQSTPTPEEDWKPDTLEKVIGVEGLGLDLHSDKVEVDAPLSDAQHTEDKGEEDEIAARAKELVRKHIEENARPELDLKAAVDGKGKLRYTMAGVATPPGMEAGVWKGKRRRLSKELWEEITAWYAKNPGDWRGCMVHCRIGEEMARRAWRGPRWTQYPKFIPLQVAFEESEKEMLRQQAAERDKLEEHVRKQAEEARKMKEEIARMDEGILRIGRVSVVKGLSVLTKVVPGMERLATRINDMLERGVDGKGNPVEISPKEGLAIIRQYARGLHDLSVVGDVLMKLTRLREEKPTEIFGVEVPVHSLEDLAKSVETANIALDRAKKFGMLRAIDGGKSAAVGSGGGVSKVKDTSNRGDE